MKLFAFAMSILIYTSAFAGLPTASFDASAAMVAQAGYMLTNSRAQKTLATAGVGPCVALSLYDPVTKTTVLAHFDANIDAVTETDHLISLFKERGIPLSRIRASVAGGWRKNKASEATSAGILKSLAKNRVKLVSKDINAAEDPFGAALTGDGALDLKVGKVDAYRDFQIDTETGRLVQVPDAEVHALKPKLPKAETGGAFLTADQASLDLNRSGTRQKSRTSSSSASGIR